MKPEGSLDYFSYLDLFPIQINFEAHLLIMLYHKVILSFLSQT